MSAQHHLTPIDEPALDTLTITEIIGRSAKPVTKLRPPDFPPIPQAKIRFGILGEWLDAHRKRRKIKK